MNPISCGRWMGMVAGLLSLGGVAMAQGDPVALPAEMMPATAQNLLLDIARAGHNTVAVGDRGAVLISADGQQWQQVPTPTRAALTAVSFADRQHGWAVGHDAVILASQDGGQSWVQQHFDPDLEKPLLDVLALDSRHAIAIGAYGLMLRTEDGGQQWAEVQTPMSEEEWHFNAIARLADQSLLIVGETGTLARSTDNGLSWQVLDSPYDSSLFGVLAHGAHGALIFGLRGNVFVSDDVAAGQWQAVDSGTVDSMFGGTRLDNGQAVLVGLNGSVLRIDGKAVHQRKTPAGSPLSSVLAVGGALMAVGNAGIQTLALP
ncbi:YCF48-related protein [Sinimarinibacterium sp. NLF-5-8]|uniref:WD40/YVTN/BNR-like repeat-containing protein n=1 Tax=Sinimarinibacterium sp. NLF-5-8 TaxID=2698684 RepID=UPI00137BA55F|nr:YCF48-related protein [Sinimarinibacterium sp. NLF-5-8]QHS09956.1 hypothetical protein GT972_07245 [Sinimarinibacterium sp. NLF-5-8]